jgi:hypothetical protein
MATINLGKVKGEPFRYEDFTHEQLEALKGKDFKYEDFSPEQLDKLKSKVKIGTVETLDADQEATVTSSVDGNVTTLNIGIPRGNGVNSYSGTREEYNNIADTIKDGSLVNITDENDFDDENLIGQVTMQRLNDIEDNFDNIKPHALKNPTNNLLATVAGTALDAVQGKALNDRCSAISEKLLVSTNVLGDRAIKTDMLDVDFSSSSSDKNKVHRIGTSDATLLANSPVTSGQFYGKWECIPYGLSGTGSSRLMVIITEFYPLQGRVWFNHYNYNKWAGWFNEYDRLTGHLNTISKSKIAFGEMGAYENLEVRGSICCQFNVYNKCDVHISCKVLSNTVGGTTNFAFLSGAKIRELLGINSLSVNAFSTKTIIQNFSGTNFSNLAGNGGFRALTTTAGDVQIGRIYTTDGQIGSWGIHSDLFKPGTIFEIDLYNCSYT